jgi:hypothetical protein
MRDYSRYNLYAMAADPNCSTALREEADNMLTIGDEDEYSRLKDLANRIDEVASRYEHSKLISLAEEFEEGKRKRNDGRYI